MQAKFRDVIDEALKGSSSAIAVFSRLRTTTRSRADRADIDDAIAQMRSVRRRLRVMERDARRHSAASVCVTLGRMAEVILEFWRKYPPQT